MDLGSLLVLLKLAADSGFTVSPKTEPTPPTTGWEVLTFVGPPPEFGLPPPETTPSGQILTEEQKRALRG